MPPPTTSGEAEDGLHSALLVASQNLSHAKSNILKLRGPYPGKAGARLHEQVHGRDADAAGADVAGPGREGARGDEGAAHDLTRWSTEAPRAKRGSIRGLKQANAERRLNRLDLWKVNRHVDLTEKVSTDSLQ